MDVSMIPTLIKGGVMKRNIDDFDGMKDFIISIIMVVAWILIGTIIVVGYYTIETKGESIIISLVSMVFTMISALGIGVTIIVYYLQKASENIKINKVKKSLIEDLSQIIDNIQKILDFNNDDEAMILKNEKGVSICNGKSGAGFTINKFNNIDYLDIYKAKLINHDPKASIAISRIKEFIIGYNSSIDKLISEASINGDYYYEKSPIINLFNGKHNLDIIKMWISTIK